MKGIDLNSEKTSRISIFGDILEINHAHRQACLCSNNGTYSHEGFSPLRANLRRKPQGSSAYYQAKAPGDEELSLMRHLDALHLHYPFYGARRLRDALLDEQDLIVDRKHVRRLMLLMDIHAVYPGNKGTSKPNKAHRIYPYLLRDIEINWLNQYRSKLRKLKENV